MPAALTIRKFKSEQTKCTRLAVLRFFKAEGWAEVTAVHRYDSPDRTKT